MMPMVMVMLWLNRAVVVDKEEDLFVHYHILSRCQVSTEFSPNIRRWRASMTAFHSCAVFDGSTRT